MDIELLIDEERKHVLRNMRKRLVVGRAKDCDIIFQDNPPQVAKHHCVILCDDGDWFLLDDFSTHRTLVNGCNVKPGEKTPLQIDDIILLGEHTIRICKCNA